MLNFLRKGVLKLNNYLNKEIGITPDNLKILELEIQDFKYSQNRLDMIRACEYYNDNQDILHRERTMISREGQLEVIHNVPNEKILDNQFAIHVDKKVNYLLGKPFTIRTHNEAYTDILETRLGKAFKRKLNIVGEDMVKCGVGYMFPYYKNNELKFKRFKPYEIKVYYADDEKEDVDFFFRLYSDKVYVGTTPKIVEFVDVYTKDGVNHYRYDSGSLIPDKDLPSEPYMTDENEQAYNWDRVPLIVFKYNPDEQILFRRVKSLQDCINILLSNYQNGMEEDTRNTILVVENYDGQDLGELRRNLATFGAVKVKSAEGKKGDVRTLTMAVNSENYKVILEELRKALVKNMKSVDIDQMKSGAPNQMNIQSMFVDIDQDASSMEIEIQSAMSNIIWFVDTDLELKGEGNYHNMDANFDFNRDLMSDEGAIVDNVVKLINLVSDETLLAQIPFVNDPEAEKKRVDEQRRQDMNMPGVYGYGGMSEDGEETNTTSNPQQDKLKV